MATLEFMNKLETDSQNYRSSTQERLRNALTSQENAKCVKYCVRPEQATGPDMCRVPT